MSDAIFYVKDTTSHFFGIKVLNYLIIMEKNNRCNCFGNHQMQPERLMKLHNVVQHQPVLACFQLTNLLVMFSTDDKLSKFIWTLSITFFLQTNLKEKNLPRVTAAILKIFEVRCSPVFDLPPPFGLCASKYPTVNRVETIRS